MENIGYIKLHRKLFDSDIFIKKPSEWLKIWIFILGKVNHIDNGVKEGSKFFTYGDIARECRLTYKQVEKCLAYLKQEGMVHVDKVTHGGIISVANWSDYQGINDTPKGKQKGNRRETEGTIYNNKNARMKEDIISTKVDNNSETSSLIVQEEFGNKEVNEMLALLKRAVGVSDFKDSVVWQRRYTKNIMELTKKIGKEEFLERLKAVLSDEFKAKNCNKLSYLYGELKAYIHSPVLEPENKGVKITRI